MNDILREWINSEQSMLAIVNEMIPRYYKQQEQEVIKFITEDLREGLIFNDVDQDQFFINEKGWLCQKVSSRTFNSIADEHGEPWSNNFDDMDPDTAIQKILPKVTKIEF